jgi:hypothetical protein
LKANREPRAGAFLSALNQADLAQGSKVVTHGGLGTKVSEIQAPALPLQKPNEDLSSSRITEHVENVRQGRDGRSWIFHWLDHGAVYHVQCFLNKLFKINRTISKSLLVLFKRF